MESFAKNTAALLKDPSKLKFLGSGLCFAWSFLLWQTFGMSTESHDGMSLNPIWLISAVTSPAVGAAMLLTWKRWNLERRWPRAAAGAAGALGTACLLVLPSLQPGALQLATVLAGGLLTGISAVTIYLFWSALLVKLSTQFMEVIVPSSCLATLILACVAPMLAQPVTAVLLVALPIMSVACLSAAEKAVAGGAIDGTMLASFDFPSTDVRHFRTADLVRICLAMMTVGTVSTFFFFLVPGSSSSLMGTVPLANALGIVLAIAATVAVIVYFKPTEFASVYGFILTPCLISVALLGVGTPACIDAALIAGIMVFMVSANIPALFFAKLSQQTRRSIVMVWGMSSMFSYGGCLIGGVLASIALPLAQSGLMTNQDFCFVLVIVLALTLFMVPAAKVEPADASAGRSRSAHQAGGSGEPGQTGGAVAGAADRDAWIDLRCHELADGHALTNRETEILGYLLRGRSQPYIRDLLCVSQNTVASHVRSIYRKLDVHSRQELLSLAERNR